MNWIEALKTLDNGSWESVNLLIDGHEVSYGNTLKGRTYIIQWYYDGVWQGAYAYKDNAIAQKFGKPIYYKMGKKFYDVLKFHKSKKQADKEQKEYDSRIMMYDYKWNNANELIKHLKKNFTDIKVVEDENQSTN